MGDELETDTVGKEAAFKTFLIPLARYINHEDLLNKSISADEIISNFRNEMDLNNSYSPEAHLTPLETHSKIIEAAIESKKYLSAAILIAVSLEEDINSFLRIGCTAKGFSHKQITRFTSETSIKTKIELIFPLLGLNFPEQYRIAIYEFIPLRNSAVHGKAVPSFFHDESEVFSSIEENKSKAEKLLKSYSMDKLSKYSALLNDEMNCIPELNFSGEILNEYLRGD